MTAATVRTSAGRKPPKPAQEEIVPREDTASGAGSRFEHLLYVGVFAVLAFIKCPGLFLDPRFWAEEGSVYFAKLREASFWQALTLTNLGSYQGLENLSVYLATLVPLEFAPTVTTYLAFLLHAAVAFQIATVAAAYGLSRIVGLLLVAAWVLVPQSYEVWLSATNMQWVVGVSMLMVFALPAQQLERQPLLYTAWATVCGLSGIPGVLLAPFFLIRWVDEKSKALLAIGIAGLACGLVQAAVVVTLGSSGRQYVTDPLLLVMPTVLQSILAPLFSAEFAGAIGYAINTHLPHIDGMLLGCLILAAGVGHLAYSSSQSVAGALTVQVIGLAVLVSLIQTFGALGNARDLLSGYGGARYYLFGSMSLCLLLAWGTKSADALLRKEAFALLVLVTLTGVAVRYTSTTVAVMLAGPSFRQQVRDCDRSAAPACRVQLWPPTSGRWNLEIKRAAEPPPAGQSSMRVATSPHA